jgi:uncharacterized MAPEG superfamily protein
MTAELFWLAATLLMSSMLWIPYILNRMKERGAWNALWEPQGETQAVAPWAERMMRAHGNAVENLVIFAPLVLALQLQDISNALTETACIVYFFARATHYIVFTLGVPLLRVIAFVAGFACQLALALTLLGAS